MHKLKSNVDLLKTKCAIRRLHDASVFVTYKPNSEKAKSNVMYKGAIKWNELSPIKRNLDFTEFKTLQSIA